MTETVESTLRVGPAGWAYDDWKGIVYPPGMERRMHPLNMLCRMFDTVEINVTFYRPVTPDLSMRWVREVAGNATFKFTAKLWERYTHRRDSWPGEAERARFLEGLKPLVDGGRFGALLAQFPWSFRRTPENRRWLGRILDTFSDWPVAVELRHLSWDGDALYEGLAKRGVAFCNIDQPVLADAIGPSERITAPLGYVRFHGRNAADWFRDGAGRNDRYNYLYSEEELQPWLDRIRRMRERVNELYVVTNNHYRGQAIVNAIEIQAAIGKPQVLTNHELIAAYPRLARLLVPQQGNLRG